MTEKSKTQRALLEENQALENRLAEARAQLEDANREMEAFTYSVSHDLKGPVRAIDGFTKMILKDYSQAMDAEFRRRFEIVLENTQLMAGLIEGLLTLSRIGRKGLSCSTIDMRAMFETSWKEINACNPGRKIDFRIGNLLPAYGDASLIRQVVSNLLSNAGKFTRRRKQALIEVNSCSEEGALIYSVKDNGTGFDMQYYNKLFGVFQRLHSASEFEGTGIGLAIVQRIIQKHEGRVWAEGKPGKGAAFYFSLPAGKQPRTP